MVAPADDPRNKRKIQEIIQKYPITVSWIHFYIAQLTLGDE